MNIIKIDISGHSVDTVLAIAEVCGRLGVKWERGGDVPETSAPVSLKRGPAPIPAKARERKARQPRAHKADDGRHEKVLAAVMNTDGAVSSIAKEANLSLSQTSRAIKELRGEGRVFKSGELRFARYGLSAEQAAERSKAAS